MVRGPHDGRADVVDLGIEGCEQAVEIGRGGFSVVYRAWQPSFERHVAVKVLSAPLEPSEIDRFSRECAAIGRLQGHPNIVTVHGAARLATGQPYIVMEYLSEGSLGQLIAEKRLTWTAVVDIGIKLAGALESAHRARVLHRDVKPGNVMLSRFGDHKLGDFGIARMEGRLETRSGVVTASWAHAPPEVLDGERPTGASDIYSLASTMFNLIDGSPPYVRGPDETAAAYLARILGAPLRAMSAVVPEAVGRVITQGLAKAPEQRQVSAAEFGRQLQAAQSASQLPVTPLPLAVDEKATRDRGPDVTEHVVIADLPATEDAPPRPEPTPVQPRAGRKLIAGTAAVGAAAVVLALVAVNLAGGNDHGTSTAPTTSTSSTVTDGGPPTTPSAATATTLNPASAAVPGTDSATSTAPPAPAAPGVRLGPDLPPVTTEPCRAPTTASGSAWQLAPAQVGGRPFEVAYYCNLFAGATGSLDFVLGGSSRLLTTSIGFADGSTSTSHVVRFEFIGDGRENLIAPRTLKFGEVQDLQIGLTGVTRLTIRITELSRGGGSEGASRPVLAAPTLTPV